MYLPTRQRTSEDREKRKHFDLGEIFSFVNRRQKISRDWDDICL